MAVEAAAALSGKAASSSSNNNNNNKAGQGDNCWAAPSGFFAFADAVAFVALEEDEQAQVSVDAPGHDDAEQQVRVLQGLMV